MYLWAPRKLFYIFFLTWPQIIRVSLAFSLVSMHSRRWIHWYLLPVQWHNSQIGVGFDPQAHHAIRLGYFTTALDDKIKMWGWEKFYSVFRSGHDGRGHWRDGGGLLYDWPCEVSSFHLLSKACRPITASQCCVLFLNQLSHNLSELCAEIWDQETPPLPQVGPSGSVSLGMLWMRLEHVAHTDIYALINAL